MHFRQVKVLLSEFTIHWPAFILLPEKPHLPSSWKNLNGKPVYHVTGAGKNYSFLDNFFKVRDKYESFIDTSNLQPLKFIRNVSEGSYKKYENMSFNKTAHTAITNSGVFKTPDCIQDVLSTMYYARNIDL